MSCIVGKYLYGTRCVDQCDPGMAIVNGSICQLCDVLCLTCLSSNFSYCLSCYTGKYLYNGVCGLDCPAGTYKNSSSYKCELCEAPCGNCLSLSYC